VGSVWWFRGSLEVGCGCGGDGCRIGVRGVRLGVAVSFLSDGVPAEVVLVEDVVQVLDFG